MDLSDLYGSRESSQANKCKEQNVWIGKKLGIAGQIWETFNIETAVCVLCETKSKWHGILHY